MVRKNAKKIEYLSLSYNYAVTIRKPFLEKSSNDYLQGFHFGTVYKFVESQGSLVVIRELFIILFIVNICY